jgi:hypothetical protein
MQSSLKPKVRPLSPDLWSALEDLLGREGCHGCWCMYWRIGPPTAGGQLTATRPHFAKSSSAVRLPASSLSTPTWLVPAHAPRGVIVVSTRVAAQTSRRSPRMVHILPLRLQGVCRRGVSSALIAAAVKAAKDAMCHNLKGAASGHKRAPRDAHRSVR